MGRPKGSKNKPKVATMATTATPTITTTTAEPTTFTFTSHDVPLYDEPTIKAEVKEEKKEEAKKASPEELKQSFIPLFDTLGSVFNASFEEPTGEPQKPVWTKQHTELWANAIVAMDQKYGFLGKMGDYSAELMLASAVVSTGILAFQAYQYNRSKGRGQQLSAGTIAVKDALTGEVRNMSPKEFAKKERELDQLAQAEIERRYKEQGLT